MDDSNDKQRREVILSALSEEPRMTAEQLAQLKPLGRNGQELRPFLPKANARLRPGSYSHTQKVLKNLLGEKQVTRRRDHASEPYIWALPGTRYPDNFWNKHHELACAEVYVAYRKAGVIQYWDERWQDHNKALGLTFRVNYDRQMKAWGKTFYWEIDRGMEDLSTIEDKVKKYQQLAAATQDWFYVLFTVAATRYGTIDERCEDIINVIADRGTKGYQFLVARQQDILENPLGNVFVSPKKPDAFLSLQDLN